MKPIEQLARAMCNAQDLHLKCTYPECGCTLIEPAVKACLICLIDIKIPEEGLMVEMQFGEEYPSFQAVWEAMLKTMLEAE